MKINICSYRRPSILLAFCLTLTSICQAQGNVTPRNTTPKESALSLEIIDSFVEVRTGPGRGYPIFYVIEQGELIDVLVRRTGWYEIRAKNGKTGWATASQLSRTLQATGEPADLPSVSFGDYQKNKWRVGFTTGTFTSGRLKDTDLFSGTLSYRFLGWLSFEGEAGKTFNSGNEGDFYSANVLIEPFSQWRLSPEIFFGQGELSLKNQPELTEFSDDDRYDNYGLSINYYLGRNFVIRGEYRWYDISTEDNNSRLETLTIGFNTFF